jgi:hypothetical protein
MRRFFNFLRNALRSLVVTDYEEHVLAAAHSAAPHAELLKRRTQLIDHVTVMEKRERELMNSEPLLKDIKKALQEPSRWLPDVALTATEAREWGVMIQSPMGIKIDTAMINFCQQQAQEAIAQPPDRIQHAAGVARGCVVAWQLAKTLSRIANAEVGHTESDLTTAEAGLDQHQP